MTLQNRYKNHPPLPIEGKRWFSIKDAAAYMAAHVHQLRELIRTGKLRHQKLGRGFVIDKIDMDHYLTENKAA